MTQEEKEFLLKDLCARLSYKVVAQVSYKDGEGWKTEDRKVLGVYTDEQVYVDCVYTNIENTKPYLRPMSSMTEKELKEFNSLLPIHISGYVSTDSRFKISSGYDEVHEDINLFVSCIDWLNVHHFDYRGLIGKGLALEAPEGMYNLKKK